MLLSYVVTDVMSHFCIHCGRCYCLLYNDLADVIANICNSGNFPLCLFVVDVIGHCGRCNCHYNDFGYNLG